MNVVYFSEKVVCAMCSEYGCEYGRKVVWCESEWFGCYGEKNRSSRDGGSKKQNKNSQAEG